MLFPIKLILFQTLFLLVTIVVEAYVLYTNLSLTKQNSIRYAVTINLYSTSLGWFSFFILQKFLSENIKLRIMDYFVLGNVFRNWNNLSEIINIAFLGIIIMILTSYLEFNLFLLLESWLNAANLVNNNTPKDESLNLYFRLKKAIIPTDLKKGYLILQANFLSSVMVIILTTLLIKLR